MEEWENFKIALFKSLKLDKFVQWLAKFVK